MSESLKEAFGTSSAVESVRVGVNDGGEPDPAWVRGVCPLCGLPLISNCYYVGGKGHLITWECWGLMKPKPTCDYRKVL